MSNTPSDAEIDAFLDSPAGLTWVIASNRERYRLLVRAVLAKWGTPPAVAGEPVAWRVHPFDYGIGSQGVYAITSLPQQRDAWLRKGWKAEPLYTTPQPTQAQAGVVPQYRLLQPGVDRIEDDDEFLSDDTTTWAIDPNGIFSGNIYGGHVLRPARRRIKGGQHGAEY